MNRQQKRGSKGKKSYNLPVNGWLLDREVKLVMTTMGIKQIKMAISFLFIQEREEERKEIETEIKGDEHKGLV